MHSTQALNLPKWYVQLRQNSHLLQPPVNNYCVHQATDIGMTVMIVGGPNARSDFHINPTPEFFYQHKGAMLLRTVDTSSLPPSDPLSTASKTGTANGAGVNGHSGWTSGSELESESESESRVRFVDIPIHENSMYLLPANTPHNPIRFADTVGVVLEQPRPDDSLDRMRWYCQEEGCGALVCEKAFHMTDLGTQVKAGVEEFRNDEEGRRCKMCGVSCAMVPLGVKEPREDD